MGLVAASAGDAPGRPMTAANARNVHGVSTLSARNRLIYAFPRDNAARRACICPTGQVECRRASNPFDPRGVPVALTQTQLATAVADRTGLSKAETKRVLDALEDVVLEELGNAEKVRIGVLVQLTVRVKPAQKSRKGRNPATGEEIRIAAKPASVDVRPRPLAKAKGALPTVRKARRRLAA